MSLSLYEKARTSTPTLKHRGGSRGGTSMSESEWKATASVRHKLACADHLRWSNLTDDERDAAARAAAKEASCGS